MATKIYDTTGQTVLNVDSSAENGGSYAFSFMNADADDLVEVQLALDDVTASTDGGSVTVSLYSSSNGSGNPVPSAKIATLGVIADSLLGTTPGLVTLSIPSGTHLAAGTRYWIQITGSGTSQAQIAFESSAAGTGASSEYYYETGVSTANTSGATIASVSVAASTSPPPPVVSNVYDTTGQVVSNVDNAIREGGSFAFSFLNADVDDLAQVQLDLGDTQASTDGGFVTVSLYSSSGDSIPVPVDKLATLGIISDASLGTNPGLVTLTIPRGIHLAANTRYWIEITGSSTSEAGIAYEVGATGTGASNEYFNEFGSSNPNSGGAAIASVGVVVCYCAGTLILTERGEVPVERLSAGDRVVTFSGVSEPVIWIGKLSFGDSEVVNGGFLPPAAWPVRIAAGAFGPGVPHTDLRVSGNHALYHDGVLIPAFCLVNGTTIRVEPVSKVAYFHVELPAHDLVLANGMASESWLDTGNRGYFDNAAVRELHRGVSDALVLGGGGHCVPCVTEGPAVVAARRAVHAQALKLGWAYTQQPDMHLMADGVRIDPAWQDGGVVCFTVPAGTVDLRLASRAMRIMDRAPESLDYRALGVAIDALRLDGTSVELARLEGQGGWWGVESDAGRAWRWTDGAAVLPAGTMKVMASVAHCGEYLAAPDEDGTDRGWLALRASGAD